MKGNILYDDFGYETKELRVLPCSSDGNILCGYRGYLEEINYRMERNKSLGESYRYKLPLWEDLKVYDKIEDKL